MTSRLIELNAATSQYGRWLRALDPGYAKVDGRSQGELQTFAVDFARLIYFYNLMDRIDGNWSPFFLADTSMVLASIENANMLTHEYRFDQLEELFNEAKDDATKWKHLREEIDTILLLAQRVDQWLAGLSLQIDNSVARLMEQAITAEIDGHLRGALQRLKENESEADIGSLSIWKSLGPSWQMDRANPSLDEDLTLPERMKRLEPQLKQLFHKFVDTILDLQSGNFGQSGKAIDQGNTKPQIALYRGFTQLFRHAQKTVNTFSRRYANFYYRDVLRESPRDATGDSVFLNFLLNDDEESFSSIIPEGTLFQANVDEDENEILYSSNKDLSVSSAQIAKQHAIRVLSDTNNSNKVDDSHDKSPSPVKGILATEIFVPEEQTVEQDGSLQNAWPTFGAAVVCKNDVFATRHATLGFAIASPYLLLTGGTREVTITIDLSSEVPETLRETTALQESFKLYASTTGGWFEIKEPAIVLKTILPVATSMPDAASVQSNASLIITFGLEAQAPSIVPYDPEDEDVEEGEEDIPFLTDDSVVLATNPSPTMPTIKFYLQDITVADQYRKNDANAATFFECNALFKCKIKRIQIDTDVKGLSNLQLQNTDGPVDTDSPFAVFGGLPTVDSFLQIRQPELFAKTPSFLAIGVNWFNLPQNESGFEGYYRDYVIGLDGKRRLTGELFNNQTFQGCISVQNPGNWELLECTSSCLNHFLFRTTEECDSIPAKNGKLCTETQFQFDTPDITDRSKPTYYDPSQSALQLQLTEPPYAFGNDLYPQNVLSAVIEDLPNVEECTDVCCSECKVILDAANRLDAGLERCLEETSFVPVNTWKMIGSWDKDSSDQPEFRDKSNAPNEKVPVKVRRRLLKWQDFTTNDKQGKFTASFKPVRNAWAMAYTSIEREQSGKVAWKLGSDDQAIVWVNGVMIYEFLGERIWDPDDAEGTVELQKGLNHIWFQTGNSTVDWEFSMAFSVSIKNCLEAELESVKLQLRAASITCFSCCAAKCLLAIDSQQQSLVNELVPILQNAINGSAIEASEIVQAFLDREIESEDGVTCVEECWEVATKVWEASDRVELCSTELNDLDTEESLVTTFQKCVVDLQQLYEDCLQECLNDCMQPKPVLKYPNEPYLPQATNVTVDYSAHCESPVSKANSDSVALADLDANHDTLQDGCAAFFHLMPMDGYCERYIGSGETFLLPQYPAGSLYLGFSRLKLPENLTLLFQVTSRAEQACDPKLPAVKWSYLRKNRWHKQDEIESEKDRKHPSYILPENNDAHDRELKILADTTNGLKNSGIVTFQIPGFDLSANENTVLPNDYFWLRATAKQHAGEFPKMVAIYPNAVTAKLQSSQGFNKHLRKPLPAYSITNSVSDLPDIATINQPIESFGGRPRETRKTFQLRMSERLRHKNRANLGWDYERLLLTQFPSIWKVQTLPATSLEQDGHVPGSVIVVVVPGPDSQEVMDPTAPTYSAAELSRFENYLGLHTSPFIKLKVVNPNYVRITVDATVQFYDNEAPGSLTDRLNDDLIEFLSPWFYDATRVATHGTYASLADISEFIRTRPYVESLFDADRIFGDGGCRNWRFLTSAHAHQIRSIKKQRTEGAIQ